jgi:NAD(P)-dependent dehydrogenase (short-subunit alcohol dehydrogenase family)
VERNPTVAVGRPLVILVTGANRGIGRAIAAGLVGLGHVVAVGARSRDAAEETAAALTSGLASGGGTAGECFGVPIDVTDQASVDAAVSEVTRRTGGRLDVVVNNAGGHYDQGLRTRDVTDDDLRDAFEVNVIGAWRTSRAALPFMLAAGRGRIVNVSSRSGTFSATWANAPAYGTSKAALNMLTVQLAHDLQGTGVLVNACCPGWVRTDMGGPDAEKSVEEGADTPIWLATLPDDGPSGQMFGERSPLDW